MNFLEPALHAGRTAKLHDGSVRMIRFFTLYYRGLPTVGTPYDDVMAKPRIAFFSRHPHSSGAQMFVNRLQSSARACLVQFAGSLVHDEITFPQRPLSEIIVPVYRIAAGLLSSL
jgi:hypothetical protein